MTRGSTRIAGLCVASAALATTAWADPPPEAALLSVVGWGQTIVPDRASLSTQAGYDGAQQRAQASGVVETRLVSQLSLFAAVTYGEETTGVSRPALGAAYQFLDPRLHAIGLRVSSAYKPEGFSEPAGEFETIVNVSHLIDRDVARTFVAFGSDPDGRESDAELGTGYLHRLSDHVVVGGTARYRYALARKTITNARWDLIAGAVGDVLIDRWRVELLLGGGAKDVSHVTSGPLGLVSVGVDL